MCKSIFFHVLNVKMEITFLNIYFIGKFATCLEVKSHCKNINLIETYEYI
jgi:hypothetical protein